MRRWAYLLGGWCWLCVEGASGRGYLPAIGPSPIRFLQPGQPAPVAELPTIAAMTAVAVSVTNSSVSVVHSSPPPEASVPEAELEPEPDLPLAVEKPKPLTPSTAVATNSFVPMLNEPLTIAPQGQSNTAILESLVSLFKNNPSGTNRLDQTLLLPVNLLPAPNSKPPSSSATYSNP